MITFSRLGKFGQLGNQLFQIAAIVAHAQKLNTSFVFPETSLTKRLFPNNIQTFVNMADYKLYKEPHFHFNPIPLEDNLDLRGFFQSEKYFIESDIVSTYKKYQNINLYDGNTTPARCDCAVHVRRTDYLLRKHGHIVLEKDYYDQAMGMIKASHPYTLFHFYSDDIKWCIEEFGYRDDVTFHNDMSMDPFDVILEMSSYKNIITANSSFSWWAAYLNYVLNNAMIITPKKWFDNFNELDLIPNGWIKI